MWVLSNPTDTAQQWEVLTAGLTLVLFDVSGIFRVKRESTSSRICLGLLECLTSSPMFLWTHKHGFYKSRNDFCVNVGKVNVLNVVPASVTPFTLSALNEGSVSTEVKPEQTCAAPPGAGMHKVFFSRQKLNDELCISSYSNDFGCSLVF